jgi:hypothetical protein
LRSSGPEGTGGKIVAPLRHRQFDRRLSIALIFVIKVRWTIVAGFVSFAISGRMHYFDSRNQRIGMEHILGFSALPPAFPAVTIDGDPYWDGGIYSNTPIEVVFDDHPRRD